MAMSKRKTIFMALITMFLWGSLFPMIKLGYAAYNIESTMDTILFAGVRFVICGGLICVYSLVKSPNNFKAVGKSIVPIVVAGLLAIVLHYSFTYSALQITDSSKTAILKQIGMLFYVCFSALFFKDDRLNAKKLIGTLMGIAGIVAINWSDKGISFNIGDAMIIAASFCIVSSNIISKKTFHKIDPITFTGTSQLFGGLVLLAIGLVGGGNMSFSVSSSPVFLYMCFASTVSYCLWYTTIKDGELSKLFIIKFAEPVFACILGAVILGENILNLQYMSAFLLIAGGIYISNK